MGKNVANQLVETLVNAGVKRIYAITGDSLNQVNSAVRESGKIEWVHVRHEESGAYAAGAEAQLTGELACCAGSSGPGHVHLINGLYDAHRSCAPVLAIASTIPSGLKGMEYFQETNTIKLFEDCSYYNQLADSPQQFLGMLQRAMQTSIVRRGVSVVGLPGDIAGESAVDILTSTEPFKVKTVIAASKCEVDAFARTINEVQKITIFCGVGCRDAHKEVMKLAELLKAPVAYTFKAKMDMQFDNPNEVGMTGLLGLQSGYSSMHEAELLIMLGTDFPYSAFIPQKTKIVQVDINPEKLGRRMKVDLGICGDIKEVLTALLPMIENRSDDKFLKSQKAVYEKVKEALAVYVDSKGSVDKIHPEYVMSQINRLVSDQAVFTVDTGMTCVWAARYLMGAKGRQMLGSFVHGSMANALPQAIGAAFACPEKQIIALCGDGGISMTLGDLQTISQYKLPVKVVVFNNHSLGMVKLEMEVIGLPDWQTDMDNPDFELVAQAMHIPSAVVRDPEDVDAAIKEALTTEGPYLLNVITDSNALAMPPKVEVAEMVGFTKSMIKLIMMGRSKEVLSTIQSNFKHIKEVF